MNHNMIFNHIGFSKKKFSYEVALKWKKQIAEGTYEFAFEKPEGFIFNAGQHVRMTLINPHETDSEGNSRFLTLASTPQEKNLVVAMRMRDTAFKRVLGSMQVGEKVLVEMLVHSLHGSFTLHEDTAKPAVFLVAGIGIVPAYSMIKDAIQKKLPYKLYLFYTNRRPEDAPYLEELETLAKRHTNFTFIATITEPNISAELWKGETGYINSALVKHYIDDLKTPIYYIAGMPDMVKAMNKMVHEAGVDKESIRSEEFSRFKMGHSANPKKYSHIIIAAVVLLILAVIFIHAIAAISLYHTGFSVVSLSNPVTYIMIGVMLALIVLKLIFVKHKKLKGGEK